MPTRWPSNSVPRRRRGSGLSVAAVIALIALLILISGTVLVAGVLVIARAINDITAHGASFWNVFWIVLVSLTLLGGVLRLNFTVR